MPKALNLTNQIFGNLKVLSKVPSRNHHTYWLCECLLCGNTKEIQTAHLTSGVTQSCGCQKKEFPFGSDLTEKQCALCGKIFIPNLPNRRYCFDCVPIGLSPTDTLRFKKRKLKHQLIQYKGGKCEICGYNKCEGALQFHHRNPTEKEFQLSDVNLNASNFSMENLQKEVDKCDLLCANCHAEQHYKEDE